MKNSKFVIIGAGIGGLICGCYLAKKGRKVIILERHNKPGGCVTSITRKNVVFDVGAHLIGSCGERGLFTKYLSDLGITIDFIRLNPTDRFHFPDISIAVPQDIDDFIKQLSQRFPAESESIGKFFKELFKIARNFDSNIILNKYQEYSYKHFLDKFFSNIKLRAILSAQFNYIGSSPKTASALLMCLMMYSYLKEGTYIVKGGAQNLSDKLAHKFLEYGGTLLLNTSVEKICVKATHAISVITNTGHSYAFDCVISNMDAPKTIHNLVGDEFFPTEYIEKINNYKIGKSSFMVFLIANIPYEKLVDVSGWHYLSYDLDNPRCKSFYIFVSTLYDDSLNRNGMHNIELAMPFPYDVSSIDDWSKIQNELETNLIDRANEVIKDLKKNILYKFSATPKTIERFTNNSNGTLYGWEMSTYQVQRYGLDHETPIKNLFLVGHWTKPGCGVVSVATSAWKLAKKIVNRE
ncbi:MAG: NAD(P)/FAD-dependent oxidoreductase [Candidatus Omnitrophica bacterium]|nr:NAD(P)/FAD-dependent oxidoreductase [Candidatus Omnitrophota bacterium]